MIIYKLTKKKNYKSKIIQNISFNYALNLIIYVNQDLNLDDIKDQELNRFYS